MSQALRIAVVARLQSDTALCGLLTTHPDDPTHPAIFNGTKNQAPPVYDCLTYRIPEAKKDARFRPVLPGAGGSDIEDFILEAEAWSNKADSAPLEAIAARLEALFENQAFDTGAGRVFKTECVMSQADLYDTKFNCWYGLFRYKLRLQRAAQGSDMPANIIITASGPLSRPSWQQATFYLDTGAGPLTTPLFAATGSYGSYTLVNVGTNPAMLPAAGTDSINGLGSLTLAPGEAATLSDYQPGKFAITMTVIKPPAATSRVESRPNPATSTSAAPLAVPLSSIDELIVERVITTAQSDYLFSASQGGRNIKLTIANDSTSTANLTFNSASGETISDIILGVVSSIVLQPGESRTMINRSSTVWETI